MTQGTHDFEDDARNDHILVWVNGALVPRERAVVSVFDSGFVLGDGVWEGLRVKAGHPDLTGHPSPGPELLGYDVVDRYLRVLGR